MKKKFLTFVLTLCLIIPAMLGLTACGKTDDNESNNSQNNETVEAESRKGKAYTLFVRALTAMDNMSDYQVKYDYVVAGKDDEYEYYSKMTNIYDYIEDSEYNQYMSSNWVLRIEHKSEGNDLYKYTIYPCINGSLVPTNYYTVYCDGKATAYSPLGRYVCSNYNYSNDMKLADEEIKNSFSFIQFMMCFGYRDIFDFEFNESGDFKIAFNYTDQNEEYIYEYSVTNEGDIESCIVYEKDILNNDRESKYCEITFTPNESNIQPHVVVYALEAIISTCLDINSGYFDNDRDLFGYHTESN